MRARREGSRLNALKDLANLVAASTVLVDSTEIVVSALRRDSSVAPEHLRNAKGIRDAVRHVHARIDSLVGAVREDS